MARHRTFDREEVLTKAMQTFWHKGYAATSMQDLVDSMGINRGSLYNTFGDKHSLFLAAIAHYDEQVVKQAVARLEADNAGKLAIAEYFYTLVERAINDSERRGCLATNSAVELCIHDQEVATRVTANLSRVERALKCALKSAQQQGDLTPERDLDALAQFLLCTLQGLRVISKLRPERELLHSIVRTALSVLD
ncbi:MAG: TetR/AcrR family transcriptional regulator [Spirulinaceae cyanobacterium RM2_2_10]|nr:TetR/AcrR family transcriptional regulator [Spirulinaceae cyanobacterium SM2_1_0]NJO20920.1 TetR/AcrR family transcriptional regulator [Spirulinaceae cyanobacterium RM2_2_10]